MAGNISFSDNNYEEAVALVACIIYSMCCADTDGNPYFAHACENNLNAPADMLARVGVMDEIDDGLSHKFGTGWKPGLALDIERHSCEPSQQDLILALLFFLDWSPSVLKTMCPISNEAMPALFEFHPSKHSTVQRNFHAWAIRRAGKWLLKQNMAVFVEGEGLAIEQQHAGHKILEPYWDNRQKMKMCVGNSESTLFP